MEWYGIGNNPQQPTYNKQICGYNMGVPQGRSDQAGWRFIHPLEKLDSLKDGWMMGYKSGGRIPT